jgi:hypothetical protein
LAAFIDVKLRHRIPMSIIEAKLTDQRKGVGLFAGAGRAVVAIAVPGPLGR